MEYYNASEVVTLEELLTKLQELQSDGINLATVILDSSAQVFTVYESTLTDGSKVVNARFHGGRP